MGTDTSKPGPKLREWLDALQGAPGGEHPCTALEAGLASLQGLLGLRQVGVYLFGDDFGSLEPALLWPRRASPRSEGSGRATLSWFVAEGSRSEVLRLRDGEDLPERAPPERAWLERQGLSSAILIPFRVEGALAGMVVLGCVAGDTMAWVDDARPHLVRLGAWIGSFTTHLRPPSPGPTGHLRRLVDLAEVLGTCEDAETLQRTAVERPVRDLGFGRCSLYLRDGKHYRGVFSASAPDATAAGLEGELPPSWRPPTAWFEALAAGGSRWFSTAPGGTPAASVPLREEWTVVTAVMSERHANPHALLVNHAPVLGRPPDGPQQEMLLLYAGMLGRAMGRCEGRISAGRADATSRRNERLESMAGMAGVLAHDLNNLLMPVIGYSKLVADGLDEESEFRTEALEILRAAEEVSELAARLLAVGRRRMRQLGVSDLPRLVAERRSVLNEAVGENIRLSIETGERLPLIQADPDTLLEMLRHTLLNAREALPDGGEVHIQAESCELGESFCGAHVQVRPGSYVRISVRDNGRGMPFEVAAHAFDPFFSTKSGRGVGLGLSTVYGAARQCGGCVDLDSRPGHGTRVDLILPPARSASGDPGLAPPAPIKRGTETVLVVEDEDRVRGVVVRMLETLGYRVLSAADGPAALEQAKLHDGHLDLVLTDVVMPGMDGRETVEQLRRLRTDFRVLYMSGFADAELGDPRLEILRKPFTDEKLGRRVREVLDS